MALDHAKLVNLRRCSDGWTAQCPECARLGSDLHGKNHLRIYLDGKYGCAVDRSPEHYQHIHALAGLNSNGEISTAAFAPEESIDIEQTWPIECLDRLIKDYSYWEGRGISANTVEPFKGGVATSGYLAGRFVFPIFDENGLIIGFDGRNILPTQRGPDGKPFIKPWKIKGKSSRFIWGGLDEIEDRAILTESIGDSLKLRQYGVPETLCLFGINMSETVLGWLIAHNPRQIIISTNRDELKMVGGKMVRPGQAAAVKIKAVLDRFFDPGVASILHPPEHLKDWGEGNQEDVRKAFLEDSPNSTLDNSDKIETMNL